MNDENNQDIFRHFTAPQIRLLNYFIGAPVMVKTGLTSRLMPYEGIVLAYIPENVRLPTLYEALHRCPGIWLIPWPEQPEGLKNINFQAWFRELGNIETYPPGRTVLDLSWKDVKAIQILPELKQ